VTVAATVIGLSDIAFLAGYYGYLEIASWAFRGLPWIYHDAGYMGDGVIIGVIVALWVASSLRNAFWAHDAGGLAGRRHWWLKLWPAVVATLVAVAVGLEEMRWWW
jgi:hypothetical protein